MRPVLVGVAGPDGAGKTTLVAMISAEARRRGARVVSIHPYGCVVCRRWPAGATGTVAGSAAAGGDGLIRRVHAHVDLAELAVRLWGAALLARLPGHGGGRLVVTDRTPLDAMVKLAPPAGSSLLRFLDYLNRAYDRIVVLDADTATLCRRDLLHSAADMAEMRERFATLVTSRPATTLADTTEGIPVQLVDAVLDGLLRPRR
jgi:hypothetical protein